MTNNNDSNGVYTDLRPSQQEAFEQYRQAHEMSGYEASRKLIAAGLESKGYIANGGTPYDEFLRWLAYSFALWTVMAGAALFGFGMHWWPIFTGLGIATAVLMILSMTSDTWFDLLGKKGASS
jgi:cytosine/uracil/thiamine/allantoin permease